MPPMTMQEKRVEEKSICRLFNSPRIFFVTTGIIPQDRIHRLRKKNDLAVLFVSSNFNKARAPQVSYSWGQEETHPGPILPCMSSSFMLIQDRFIPPFCACRVVLRRRGLVARCEPQDGGRARVSVLRECREEPQGPGAFPQNSIGRYCYLLVKIRKDESRKFRNPDACL